MGWGGEEVRRGGGEGGWTRQRACVRACACPPACPCAWAHVRAHALAHVSFGARGEVFQRVFEFSGMLRHHPCAKSTALGTRDTADFPTVQCSAQTRIASQLFDGVSGTSRNAAITSIAGACDLASFRSFGSHVVISTAKIPWLSGQRLGITRQQAGGSSRSRIPCRPGTVQHSQPRSALPQRDIPLYWGDAAAIGAAAGSSWQANAAHYAPLGAVRDAQAPSRPPRRAWTF